MYRRGISGAILLVAGLAVAAAAAGPIYLQAGGESILQDELRMAGPAAGLDLSQSSAAQPDPLPALQQFATGMLAAHHGARFFGTPIAGLEMGGSAGSPVDLAYRDGFCGHVRIVAGECPSRAGQIAVSVNYAQGARLHLGDVQADAAGAFTVTGIYQANDRAPFWFGRSYFVSQFANTEGRDTFFTPRATFASLPSSTRVTSVIDVPLEATSVRIADAATLSELVDAFSGQMPPQVAGTAVATTLLAVLNTAIASWHAMSVPVWLIIVQLVALAWLLFFLVVSNAAEMRRGEIALAKLRGLGRSSVITFGLGEVLTLLLVAFPLGVLGAWLAVRVMARVALVNGIPVILPPLSLLAGGGAVLGGAVGATMATWRTLTRPVIDQLRQAEARPSSRSWVIDAVVVALLAAGLVELSLNGVLRGSRIDVIALLTPGLIALAIGLVGSRTLPLLCRAAFGPTRGRIAAYLAVREVARRPATLRTVLVVASALGLATFSVVAWTSTNLNAHDVAWTTIGSAKVLVVQPPTGQDLAAIVDGIDPSGTQAAVVDDYTDFSSGARRTLAVDTSRFGNVAYWRSDFAQDPFRALLSRLHPAEPPPLRVAGDAISATVDVESLTSGASPWDLVAILQQPGGNQIEADLGRLVAGTTQDLTTSLVDCSNSPCELREVRLSSPSHPTEVAGTLVIEALRKHSANGWQQVAAQFTSGNAWASINAGQYSPPDQVETSPAGLLYAFNTPAGVDPGVAFQDTPNPLPAIVPLALASSSGTLQVAGLDGRLISVKSIGTARALPGAVDNGVIVDRDFAKRIASNPTYSSQDEIWLSSEASTNFTARLEAAGVRILSTSSASDQAARLSRQGPGLALQLLLTAAAAAVVLAVAGSLVATHLAARRRSFELAAVRALGVKRTSLVRAILAEYGLLFGASTVLGVGAGILATALALPSVPEFVDQPAAPPLLYPIAPPTIGFLAGATAVLMALGALISSVVLVRVARAERLREAEQ